MDKQTDMDTFLMEEILEKHLEDPEFLVQLRLPENKALRSIQVVHSGVTGFRGTQIFVLGQGHLCDWRGWPAIC